MMMRRTVVSGIATLLAAASLTLSAYAQQSSTAFTYQGFLRDNGQPANGVYDLRFALFDSEVGGNQIGSVVFVNNVTVADGLFTVEVDFGAAPFNTGARLWIEIGVRPGGRTGGHSLLTPRIELTPVPYAIYAQNVANNAVSANQLANDANSLSKVSGGALSIVNGHLKRANNVYFYATNLKTFGVVEINNNFLYLLPPNQRGRTQQWVPLAFEDIKHNIGGGSYTAVAVDASNNPTETIGEYTVPVSGYYMISTDVAINSWNSIIGTVALQRKVSNSNIWETLCAYYSKMDPTDRYQRDGLTIHGVFYLNQGDKIRVAAYNRSNYLIAPRFVSGGFFSDPPFVPENHYLTIYLLSAADAPPPPQQ
jgi:hypothetical protein